MQQPKSSNCSSVVLVFFFRKQKSQQTAVVFQPGDKCDNRMVCVAKKITTGSDDDL